jgi:hypothetical protein
MRIYICILIAALFFQTQTAAAMTEVTKVVHTADVSGSLDGKHFFVYDADGTKYCIWISVSGGSATDPTPSGAVSLRANISPNATMDDVAFAIQDPILIPLSDKLGVSPVTGETENSPVEYLVFYTLTDTEVTDAYDGNSGFAVEVLYQGDTNPSE